MNISMQAVLNSTDITINAQQAAPFIGADPAYIRYQARECPEKLGFPVIVYGKRVKIPRIPFLRYLGLVDSDGAQNTAFVVGANS